MPGQLFETPPPMTERQWQSTIERAMKREGYKWQHVYRLKTASGQWRTSTTATGWPDLVAFRAGWVIAVECKGPKGRVEPGQIEWLETFAEIPTGRAWLLDPVRTDWQQLANWLHRPEDAPRTHGWALTLTADASTTKESDK